jgi:disulfide bond formation protein DsbB
MSPHALLEPRTAAILLAAASAASLLIVLALQYGAALAPCPLCVWQRWPHLGVVAAGLAALWLRPAWMLGIALVLLLGNAGLAGYHFGIEQGWWALPAGCAAGAGATSVAELRALLATAPPACDQVAFTLFGLSLAAWNGLLCLGLAAFAGLSLARAGARGSVAHQHRHGHVAEHRAGDAA